MSHARPVPRYRWPDSPDATHRQLTTLVEALVALVGPSLVGVYLHGSLALGSFNPYHSDLDLLIVTKAPTTMAAKRRAIELLLTHSGAPHAIEISSLAREQLHPWRHPTPYDLHFSEAWRDRLTTHAASVLSATPRTDADLAAHITVTRARGIVLYGAPIAATFPEVPEADFLDSLAADLDASLAAIARDPVYAILNCCRTAAYLQDGRVLSKEEGGVWARTALPPEFHPSISAALAAYRSASERCVLPDDALAAFTADMRQRLARLWRPVG